MNENPEIAAYNIELDEIYLFPERERANLVEEMTNRYPLPAFVIAQDFMEHRWMGNWLRIFWARILEPTLPDFHEITPILARVRCGCSTDREFDWLGQRIALAISLDEHNILKLVTKLTKREVRYKAPYLMTKAMHEYFDDHQRFPTFTEFQTYVQESTGERAIEYQPLTDDNWTRILRLSGVSNLFRIPSD